MIAREVDFPPVWLAGFAAAGAVAGRVYPVPLHYGAILGAVLIIVALGVMVLAVVQMLWVRTTVVPRRDPARLVTGGIFRLSRNPIYLADALLLTGLYTYWGALVAMPLVAVFMALIAKRFIQGEEDAMARIFGAEFENYKKRTRRWI